jgi:hypothetical protein
MPHSSRISFSADDLHAEELHGEADRLRREADACGNALERDKLRRRARSCDIAAEADRWVNSPGLTGPRPAENEKHQS